MENVGDMKKAVKSLIEPIRIQKAIVSVNITQFGPN